LNMKESPDDTLSEEFKCALMPIDLQYVQPPSIDVQSIKTGYCIYCNKLVPKLEKKKHYEFGEKRARYSLVCQCAGKKISYVHLSTRALGKA